MNLGRFETDSRLNAEYIQKATQLTSGDFARVSQGILLFGLSSSRQGQARSYGLANATPGNRMPAFYHSCELFWKLLFLLNF